MSKIMELAERWRCAGGREEHWALKDILQSEVERTEAEIANLKVELKRIDTALDDSRLNLTMTASEVIAELRVDAERYRWLRDSAFGYFWFDHGGCYPRTGLDAAIDNARSKQ